MAKRVPELANVPEPTAPYSPCVEASGLIFISGQAGRDPESGTPQAVAEQTRVAMRRIGTILRDLGLGFEHLVKTSVFLTDISDFGEFNAAYGEFFTGPPPARTTVEVSALPKPEFRVEIEAVATRD